MFGNKRIKELEQENDRLRYRLANEEEKNALLDTTPLPKCKSLVCVSCEHIVYQRTYGGRVFVLGCGANPNCNEYKRREISIDLSEVGRTPLQQGLLEQLES